MPRYGSLILSRVRRATLTIVYEPRGRVDAMTPLSDPLATVADCPKRALGHPPA
jgi:hypothetical protein